MLQKSDLINYFYSSFTSPEAKGIGTEHEKFIFHCKDKKRIEFDGSISIQNLFQFLIEKGWQKGEYNAFNQLISLSKNGASVTLEPGCQLELSGKILKNVHQTCTETYEHLHELQEYAKLNNLCIIGLGFDPISKREDIKFIPKDRYRIMREYMPKVGSRGLDMMTRTCTVQANFDYFDEKDLINYEKKIINLFNTILVTCKENLNAINSMEPIGNVIEVSNGTNIPNNVNIKNGDSILMVANFEYAGNFEGFKWFFDFVWPFLKSNEKYRLTLVGKYPEKLARLVNGDLQISIEGLVPHLDSYYENSKCVIIPLFNDGGTKTKLIEAIAFGVPIVATKIGAKGFENTKTISISDHPEEFAKSIQKIFENKYPTKELLQGRNKIRNQYSWDIIGDELNRIISRQVG